MPFVIKGNIVQMLDFSWKYLTPPKVEVYAHTDKGFARLGIL